MTPDEERALALTAELANLLPSIIENGPSAHQDTLELHAHIHAIQHAIMANTMARQYPTQFRTLGGTVARRE